MKASRTRRGTKALSIVGARPNFVKLAPVHRSIIEHFEHIVVHTGQHYDYKMSRIFFQNLRLPDPDYNLAVGSGGHGRQTGEMMKRLETILLREKPRVVLVYGDTNSTLAGALAAAKLRLPVAHVEAGLRNFDMKMPEEVNRVVTDHVSTYLLAPTENAIRNLRRERCWGKVFLTGDVMAQVLKESIHVAERDSGVLKRLDVDTGDYVLATVHRAENTDDPVKLSNIVKAMTAAEKKIVFPVHPRTKKALRKYGLHGKLSSCDRLVMTEPLGYLDFIMLEKNAQKILTDSGGVQREAYLLGVPCVTLRTNTEWVETLRAGWNVLVGADVDKITHALRRFNPTRPKRGTLLKEKPSEKIVKILSRELN